VPEEQPVVAACDLDGTLTTRDYVVPFLRYVAGTGGLATGFVRRAPLLVAAVARGGLVPARHRRDPRPAPCRRPPRRRRVYLRPLVARVGVVDAIGTELAVDGAGRCTGALDGGNCLGAAKVVRLHRSLGQRFGGRDNVTLWAYGNSRGDEAMLADANHPVWVRR
jgi:phosphatidylglycerophosphatase C